MVVGIQQAKEHEEGKRGESFTRWQGITIQHLGYSINLLLAFATAVLGFSFNVVRDGNFHTYGWNKAVFSFSLLFLTLSISLGIVCTVTRLCDFRKTTRIARDREQWRREGLAAEIIHANLLEHRSETKRLDERTWNLFYGQIGTFSVGMVLLIVALVVVYQAKLL